MKERKPIRTKLIIEGLIALTIAITPVLFYSHKYIAEGKQEIDILFFTLTANGFADAGTALWFYLVKIIPLTLLVIWFVTCKQWWYHAILIPISMYSFQLYSVLSSDSEAEAIDENEIFYIIAVTMVVVPIVYFIRVKLVDKHVHGIDLDAMDTELQILKEKEELRKEREKLEQRQKTLAKKM
ncbi:hypothetical protein [Flagellimonas pacifica]|uniref:Uncharacterized protein n=1 Tax=Flagellimonas pacifica TaxID=1247520 RepID=A0A285MRP0_9FLAO|nr:hypothetical protein [Allomuricauda parva]SNY99844.1 hypothetical protein SAMN06265377_1658 [Allomuricauda parva]